MIKMEHLRMRLAHEPVTSDIIDMELIELKFIFDRSTYDRIPMLVPLLTFCLSSSRQP